METAVAYYRTSSATNVGEGKDSLNRQRDAVLAYAKTHGVEIVKEFYDPAVSGADAIDTRPGFSELLNYVAGNGARMILVENASRFARDLTVQLTGHAMLTDLGYALIPVDAPDYFTEETPTAVMVRQILGAIAEFEKTATVQRLRKARKRVAAEKGKCEGRKSWRELDPELVRQAKRLHRRNPRTGKRRSLRRISKELDVLGYRNSNGNPFAAVSVQRMVAS